MPFLLAAARREGLEVLERLRANQPVSRVVRTTTCAVEQESRRWRGRRVLCTDKHEVVLRDARLLGVDGALADDGLGARAARRPGRSCGPRGFERVAVRA